MKCARFWPVLGCVLVFLCLQARAALLGLNPPTGSPAYADFDMGSLAGGYSYSGTATSGTGTLTVTNVGNVSKPDGYTSSSQSPGTGGAISGKSGPPFNFNGFYNLTATIQNNNGVFEVSGGSFTIEGDLFGNPASSILLTGTLKTGAGTLGWGTKAQNEFDFLFTTGSSGNSQILADFFGAGTGNGAIEFHEAGTTGTQFTTYAGSLSSSWVFDDGVADTFVPEPFFYPFAAAATALFGLILACHKSSRVAVVRA